MDPLDIETFFGPIFLLACLSLILYGIGMAQVYFYFTTYRDSIATRLAVLLIFGLETVHAAVCIHLMYAVLISGYSNTEQLFRPVWSIGVAAYLEAASGAVVNSFYIYRIWRLSENTAVSVYLIMVLCSAIAVTFRASTFIYMEGTWASLASSKAYMRMGYASFSLTVLMDLSITVVFLLYLNKGRSLAYTRGTKGIIRKLITYALSSGIITAIISIVTLIVFAVSPSHYHYGGTTMVLTKVYANAMLAMLNRRQGIKEEAASIDNVFSLHLSNLPGVDPPATRKTTEAAVQVAHSTVVTNDI